MRRIVVLLAVMALLLLALAAPAFADNTGTANGGPPNLSGVGQGKGALVEHCGSDISGGTQGAIVINKNARHENNCI